MVFMSDFFVAAAVALLFTIIFGAGLRGHRDWRILAPFFIMLLLVTWAGGIWSGPEESPKPWLNFFIVGLIFSFMLASLAPRITETNVVETIEEAEADVVAAFSLNYFFWIFLFGLLLVIFFHYLQ